MFTPLRVVQALVLESYLWSHKQCTSSSTMHQLSAKEKRCVQQGVATYLDARSHIAQTLSQQSQNAGHDF